MKMIVESPRAYYDDDDAVAVVALLLLRLNDGYAARTVQQMSIAFIILAISNNILAQYIQNAIEPIL